MLFYVKNVCVHNANRQTVIKEINILIYYFFKTHRDKILILELYYVCNEELFYLLRRKITLLTNSFIKKKHIYNHYKLKQMIYTEWLRKDETNVGTKQNKQYSSSNAQ